MSESSIEDANSFPLTLGINVLAYAGEGCAIESR